MTSADIRGDAENTWTLRERPPLSSCVTTGAPCCTAHNGTEYETNVEGRAYFGRRYSDTLAHCRTQQRLAAPSWPRTGRRTNVKYMACTVETDTLLYVLAGCVSVSSEPRRRGSSLSLFRLVAMLPTATADESQHQECFALMMQFSYADVAQHSEGPQETSHNQLSQSAPPRSNRRKRVF